MLHDLDGRALAALGIIYAILVFSSLASGWIRHRHPERDYLELTQRIRSWWYMVLIFSVVLLMGVQVTIAFLGLVSFLALKEFFSMIPTRRADRRVLFWAYLAIPVQFYWIATGWYGMFIIFIPVYLFLFLPLRMIMIGETTGFLHAVGTIHWGVMITVFGLSHTAYLLMLPLDVGGDVHEGVRLLLFLVVLTQLNDVAQYLWGRMFGRRPIVPRVSPNKTWAGFLGGVGTSTVLALLVGPWLTPMDVPASALSGALIGAVGFVGDVNLSAVKRDLGLKDSSQLIAGHGGVLDRVDSLSFTAPVFLHFMRYGFY